MSSPKDLLLPHLPYLRRYARALTGSQRRGDNYVAATIESILAEVALDKLAANPKILLFRSFHDVWQRLAPPPVAEGGEPENEQVRTVKRALAAMPRWDRQAYLLSRLEKFGITEIATILRAKPEEIELRIERAADQIADVPAARILIIEDDPVIALGHAQIVRDMGHDVAGIAATKAAALALNAGETPDVLLVDIRLQGDDDGIETVEEIIKTSSTPVVFVTGHPEDLLTGRKREPAFVIAKPFDPEVLKVAINNALAFRNSERPDVSISSAAE